MKRQALTLLFVAATGALTGAASTAVDPGAAWAQAGAKAPGKPSPAEEIAQKAVAAAKEDKFEDALSLFRDAYRSDRSARWLYDMGVLYDRLAECDDAAFFYRAAIWGKGVLPQDQEAVSDRLVALEEECHFKKRHATPQDRHQRAARYMGLKLCFLAQSILTGIATPAEKKQMEQCPEKK